MPKKTASAKIALTLTRTMYEIRLHGAVLRAEGRSAEQAELDAIITLVEAFAERLDPTTR